MSHRSARNRFPQYPLFGAMALVAFTFVMVLAVRLDIIDQPPMAEVTPVEVRDLQFVDRPDGGITVLEGRSNRVAGELEPGGHSFVRATLRGLARERQRLGLGPEEPFRLTRWANGLVSLEDPATGQRIRLEAFGPTQMESFTALMEIGDARR